MVIMKSKPKCETLYPWLRSNLGDRCLAPLTGTDARALDAAVQIVELYCFCAHPEVAQAFGAVVSQMQRSTRELAYHAIAHPMDWCHRSELWAEAGLDPIPVRKCSFEPGGSRIDLRKQAKKRAPFSVAA